MPPSGSASCGSKPAETSSRSGRYCSSTGKKTRLERPRRSRRRPGRRAARTLTVKPRALARAGLVRGAGARVEGVLVRARGRARRAGARRRPGCRCRGARPSRGWRPSAPRRARAASAATATLLKRQKPIARSGVAWCPGGRTRQKAFSARPASTSVTASTAAPAASSAASVRARAHRRVGVELAGAAPQRVDAVEEGLLVHPEQLGAASPRAAPPASARAGRPSAALRWPPAAPGARGGRRPGRARDTGHPGRRGSSRGAG